MKKFWKNVEIRELTNDNFQIFLDKKTLKTPIQNDLIFSNYDIAYQISLEWDIDSNAFNTDDMVFFGVYSTAIDRISVDRKLFINEIMKFVDTDLICYRAQKPIELLQLQNVKWNPIITSIQAYIDAEILVVEGIMPLRQNKQVHNNIIKLIKNFSDLEISILYRMTNITGSIFISLYALKENFVKNNLFELCFLDELWQAKEWGFEEEASIKRYQISKELKKLLTLIGLLKFKKKTYHD